MDPTKKPPSGDGYDVGYGRPPKHTQFSSTHQPTRRRTRTPSSNEVLDVLTEAIPIRKAGRKVTMSSLEISVRKLVEKAVKEKHLDNAIEFLKLCERHKLITRPSGTQSSGVLIVSGIWDQDEWIAMLNRHGAPPWPRKRSGLAKHSDESAVSLTRRPSESPSNERRKSAAVGADPTRPVGYRNPPRSSRFKPGASGNPKGRPSRETTEAAIVQRVAFEIHLVTEGERQAERTVLELVLLVVRSKAHEGNRKAFRVVARLLDDYGIEIPVPGYGFLVIPEPMSPEEWERDVAEQQRQYREG